MDQLFDGRVTLKEPEPEEEGGGHELEGLKFVLTGGLESMSRNIGCVEHLSDYLGD